WPIQRTLERCEQNNTKKTAGGRKGSQKKPLLSVPFDAVVVDTLHLFLRIMGVLFVQAMKKKRIQDDRDRYLEQCGIVNHLIDSLKSEYYTAIIKEHSSDQKVLLNTVNKLPQKKTSVKRYPATSDDDVLANAFADFFTNKIGERTIGEIPAFLDCSVSDVDFSDFVEVSEDQMIELASKSSSKSCSLDPIPSTVLKGCFKVLLPTITKSVNCYYA
ncbi:hypothetical protein QZH41_017246, partial [Actinostola sp. cb2023]